MDDRMILTNGKNRKPFRFFIQEVREKGELVRVEIWEVADSEYSHIDEDEWKLKFSRDPKNITRKLFLLSNETVLGAIGFFEEHCYRDVTHKYVNYALKTKRAFENGYL